MDSMKLGVDIGSTTIKLALMRGDEIVYSDYRRHMSNVRSELKSLIREVSDAHPGLSVVAAVTGSGGLNVAKALELPFAQEVMAGAEAVLRRLPESDVVIELGGEDAKITYMKPTLEQRMNGSCAGGTGAFIDQMSTLLGVDAAGLNQLASGHKNIYPIASRCGVFAKTDIQPLLNEGVAREDVAASVLQAVVNQTVAGLAQGRRIAGNVVFLGGPLHFLPELRRRFEATIGDDALSFLTPDDAQLFVAIGAAKLASGEPVPLSLLCERMENSVQGESEIQRMRPLFLNDAERDDFFARHESERAKYSDLATATGPLFLGIDAGSTTIKAALLSEKRELLYTYYHSNESDPVGCAAKILKELYDKMPEHAYIASTCVTGYGEALLRAALRADHGEIETIAHFKAAEYFCPDADFVIDIGGQDMKCMSIKDGVIQDIMLNEACSSGCGSFIETFAKGLGLSAAGFATEALIAENPVDLGTRCTVFMNSRVKQAQKEGATVGDISAGLSYSIVRNALYKVIKLRDPSALGKNVVVQGGTFVNDAVLRCFELTSGCRVVRSDISGIMGAFGAALLAMDAWDGSRSDVLSLDELGSFTAETEMRYCPLCPNSCRLTVSTFSGGRSFISGNRCERGLGQESEAEQLPNLFTYKYKRVFDYKPLKPMNAARGTIGIPRALNIYENYPFWVTLLTKLKFSVMLSGRSSHKLFEGGMDTIPSESVCYPAKLVHGHIADLLKRGANTIFYPSLPYEQLEYSGANNHYNCPIVTSYPEVISKNVDALSRPGITYLHPFLPLDNPRAMFKGIIRAFTNYGVTKKEAAEAVAAAYEAQSKFAEDIRSAGVHALKEMRSRGLRGIVLAGRPYHIDPEINHGVPDMINSLGLCVFTEDSVAHLGKLPRPIRVVDQWAYHTRLYEAASYVTASPDLELVQLNSFGCGLDAVTADQVQEILSASGRMYNLLKIDEISNLGAARIRIRSLKAAMDVKGKKPAVRGSAVSLKTKFTKDMRETHTIIAPQMSPFHFEFLETAFQSAGYKFKLLDIASKEDMETGLRLVNNDACFPSILVVGQLVNAFISGKYNPETTSLLITQTGGGCRATNYIAFLRRALTDAGYPDVPVISLNATGLESNPGFKLRLSLLHKLAKALVYGDTFLSVVLRTRPYELVRGDVDALHRKWAQIAHAELRGDGKLSFRQIIRKSVRAFERLELDERKPKPRVGLVGEILVKFHPDANNDVIRVVEAEGGEAVMPGLMDFLFYCMHNTKFAHDELGRSRKVKVLSRMGISVLELYRKVMCLELERSKRFTPPTNIAKLGERASKVLSLGNCMGEGWFLTAEMLELLESGVNNIICMQPFACLPNHVTGKGMIKALRSLHPMANIVPVDYDPGASEVNQLNRIKLMMATAFNALKTEPEANARQKTHKARSLI